MNRTAVIYARVSSASDRQSTDRQVADLRAFAEKEGIEVVGEYEEHGSGAREDRPELLRCVEFLRRGGCSTLLVSEISRLGRTVKGVVNTIDELTKVGVNVYVQDINLWTPDEGRGQRLCPGHQSMDAAARWQREPDGEGHPDHPRPGCGTGAQEHRVPAQQRQGAGEGKGSANGPP